MRTHRARVESEGLARMLGGELILGKTQAEKDEEKAQEIRAKRDRLLSQTDWTQTVDNPLAGDEDITAYRQALRDIPEQDRVPLECGVASKYARMKMFEQLIAYENLEAAYVKVTCADEEKGDQPAEPFDMGILSIRRFCH